MPRKAVTDAPRHFVKLGIDDPMWEQLDMVVKLGTRGSTRTAVLLGMIERQMPEALREVRDALENMEAIKTMAAKKGRAAK